MRSGKRHFSIIRFSSFQICVLIFSLTNETHFQWRGTSTNYSTEYSASFTASAVVVRIFWRRFPSFTVFGSFRLEQFEIHNVWVSVFSMFTSGARWLANFWPLSRRDIRRRHSKFRRTHEGSPSLPPQRERAYSQATGYVENVPELQPWTKLLRTSTPTLSL